MKVRFAVLALSALSVSGCSEVDDAPALASATVCRATQPPVELPLDISEASGVAVSRANPGVLWSHNDSGNDPVLFAFDAVGAPMGRVEIDGAPFTNEDWEDLALARCDDGDCLYIGDIGDNEAARAEIAVHRLPEPTPQATRAAVVESFRGHFPAGPRDAEGLFVLPSGRMFIITKGNDAPIGVYAFPSTPTPDGTSELELIRSLSRTPVPLGDQVTGAAASYDGRWVAVRTYTSLLVYPADQFLDGESVDPAIHVDLKPVAESQGEAVALGPQGSVALAGEGATSGLPGTLSLIWCADLAS